MRDDGKGADPLMMTLSEALRQERDLPSWLAAPDPGAQFVKRPARVSLAVGAFSPEQSAV